MKVNLLNNIYKSRTVKSGLEFAADYGALFTEGTALALATVARPVAIYSAPKTDKENKKLACAKSIASSLIGFGLTLGIALPLGRSIKKISKNPSKYLKQETINKLKEPYQSLSESKPYQFAAQLLKLGVRTITSVPKAIATCAIIPPVMSSFFNRKNENIQSEQKNEVIKSKKTKSLTFTGRLPKEPVTKGIGKIIDSKFITSASNKYKDSNYAMHITVMADAAATGMFAFQTAKSKRIPEERKKTLINNSVISTGLSITSGYLLDKALDKPVNKFIDNFKSKNKGNPKLEKYVEGIKIAKPALILGGIYYCCIPMLSTFFAERIPNVKNNNR